jgi:hypothetical protein
MVSAYDLTEIKYGRPPPPWIADRAVRASLSWADPWMATQNGVGNDAVSVLARPRGD